MEVQMNLFHLLSYKTFKRKIMTESTFLISNLTPGNDVETIWEEWSDRLRKFILKRVSNQTMADDILQEVFFKVYLHIKTLKDSRKFGPWVYQITRNTIFDYYRSRKPMAALPENLHLKDESLGETVLEELTLCVDNMVDRLPEKYRQAVKMTAYQGMTQKEMGEKLGISLSGAKSRTQRARAKLKRMLLNCCRFELDPLGRVIDFEPKSTSPGP